MRFWRVLGQQCDYHKAVQIKAEPCHNRSAFNVDLKCGSYRRKFGLCLAHAQEMLDDLMPVSYQGTAELADGTKLEWKE